MTFSIVKDFEQGTPEWLEWRAGHWNASEAAVIMNATPSWMEVRTWEDLRLQKAGLFEFSDSTKKMFAHGNAQEGKARELLEKQYGLEFPPAVIEQVKNPKVAASLDGLHVGHNGHVTFVEIKSVTARARGHLNVQSFFDIPKHYQWQVVHQFWALDVDEATCLFVIYDGEKINVIEFRMKKDDAAITLSLLGQQWKSFDSGHSEGRTDEAWIEAANMWLRYKAEVEGLKNKLKAPEAKMKEAEKVLELLTEGGNNFGGGVQVRISTRIGSVDTKAMEAAGIDVDSFRKPSTSTMRVSYY